MPPLDWYTATGAATGAGAGLIVAYLLIRLTIPMLVESWNEERGEAREDAREARKEFLEALGAFRDVQGVMANGLKEEMKAARAAAEAAHAATDAARIIVERNFQEFQVWRAALAREGQFTREGDH